MYNIQNEITRLFISFKTATSFYGNLEIMLSILTIFSYSFQANDNIKPYVQTDMHECNQR